MTCVSRRAVVPLLAFAVGAILTGCSSGSSGAAGAVGTSGTNPGFMKVDTSSLFVTLENRASQPLLDVHITIKPYGTMPGFSQSVSRMESSEKRDLSLGAFRSNDGTPLNPRFAKPRDVTVTAVDLTGNKFETTVPWKD